MIFINNVCRRFGENIAVDSVNFEVGKGEIIGLLGHNGAGKTTLMKMLTGFLEPSSGDIVIDGKKIKGSVVDRQQNIGYMPENLPVYPEMTVIDYLEYAAQLRGVDQSERAEHICYAISKTELTEKAFDKIDTLSRGFRQRVGVAQALLGKPKILILDEPTNGLDPSQTLHMRELILSLKEEATVIISTHIMQEVKAMCDRVIVLRQGQLALDVPLTDLIDNHTLTLKTDGRSERILTVLKAINSVDTVGLLESMDNRFVYQVKLKNEAGIEDCTAEIIKKLTEDGLSVYAIEQVQFDLEAVLQDISEGAEIEKLMEGYSNAA